MIQDELKKAIKQRWKKRLGETTPEARQVLPEQFARVKKRVLKWRRDLERRRAVDDLKEAWNSLRAAQETNHRALEAMIEELREARQAVTQGDREAVNRLYTRLRKYASKTRTVDTKPIHDRIRVLSDRVNRRPILDWMREQDAEMRKRELH